VAVEAEAETQSPALSPREDVSPQASKPGSPSVVDEAQDFIKTFQRGLDSFLSLPSLNATKAISDADIMDVLDIGKPTKPVKGNNV
jgi:hypothetical protein